MKNTLINVEQELLDLKVEEPQVERIKPEIDSSILEEIEQSNEIEKQVVVHCEYTSRYEEDMIIIWKTTFLNDRNSTHKSKLISTFNIPIHPTWLILKPFSKHTFTLVFTGLPKSCKMFDLSEEIPEGGAFYIGKIKRNKSDVYRILVD